MFHAEIVAFIGVVALLTITPGADTMLVVRSVLAHGWRTGVITTIGVCSGLFFHATLSAVGLSLILVRSAAIFDLVKLLGAGYLIVLGMQSLRSAWHSHSDAARELLPLQTGVVWRWRWWRSYSEGLLTNVLNPKVAIFYLAFLPQFLDTRDAVLAQSLMLAAIHCLLGMVWLSLVSLLLGRMAALVCQPAIRARLEGLSGLILVGFGVRLALEQHV